MEYHALADYFPMLPPEEFEQLKDSIKKFGLLEPITTLDGKILDGRNRYEACQAVGVEPKYQEYKGNGHNPLDFVVAANMRRRHLTEAQKAQIIIDVEGRPAAMGREDSGIEAAIARGNNVHPWVDVRPPSYTELARKAGVSEQTIKRVAEVQDRPELTAQLREGTMTARSASNERMREVAKKAEIEPTWQGLYAKAPYANAITQALSAVINGVDRWLSNEYGLSKIDPRGHTPLLLKRVDQAIAALERFKKALEELRDE